MKRGNIPDDIKSRLITIGMSNILNKQSHEIS